jgi:hypothetical protein
MVSPKAAKNASHANKFDFFGPRCHNNAKIRAGVVSFCRENFI